MKTLLATICFMLPMVVFGQDTLLQPGRNIVKFQAAYYYTEEVHQDFGFGMAYERILDKKWRWGLYLPFTAGFSRDKDFMEFFDYNGNGNKARRYRSLSFAPGIKWYTGRRSGKVKYSIGPSLFFERGKKPDFYAQFSSNSNPTGMVNYNIWGYMLTNSLDVYVTHEFSIGAVLGMGFANYARRGVSSLSPFSNNGYGPGTLAQCILNVGYRFK